MKLKYIESITGHRELSRAYIWYRQELDNAGLSDLTQYGPDPACSAFYFEEPDGRVVAFTMFCRTTVGTLWVHHTWVQPSLRQTGLATRLWSSVVKLAQKERIRTIQAGTHNDNYTMKRVYGSQGRKLTWLLYDYEVPVGKV